MRRASAGNQRRLPKRILVRAAAVYDWHGYVEQPQIHRKLAPVVVPVVEHQVAQQYGARHYEEFASAQSKPPRLVGRGPRRGTSGRPRHSRSLHPVLPGVRPCLPAVVSRSSRPLRRSCRVLPAGSGLPELSPHEMRVVRVSSIGRVAATPVCLPEPDPERVWWSRFRGVIR